MRRSLFCDPCIGLEMLSWFDLLRLLILLLCTTNNSSQRGAHVTYPGKGSVGLRNLTLRAVERCTTYIKNSYTGRGASVKVNYEARGRAALLKEGRHTAHPPMTHGMFQIFGYMHAVTSCRSCCVRLNDAYYMHYLLINMAGYTSVAHDTLPYPRPSPVLRLHTPPPPPPQWFSSNTWNYTS